jgi:two-component system OmpR family response regulator
MPSILFVEDDEVVRDNYTQMLRDAGFDVAAFGNHEDGLKYFETTKPDLAILDIALGKDREAGFGLCAVLRTQSPTLPIIFLTSLDGDSDKITGMRIGADDYITKDINFDYLLARIHALLRRIKALKHNLPDSRKELKRNELSINMDTMHVKWKNKSVDLNLTQVWMVHALAKDPGNAKTPDQLMTAAKLTLQPNTIVVHIKKIRNAFLAIDPDFDAIKTERSIGYRWVDEG